MSGEPQELLRRFYRQLELIAKADQQAQDRVPQRIGDLYDDAAPSLWGRGASPFPLAMTN